jgi:phosphopantothenoylcysteine decarboxylase / phosphopantothenate---cysteine ligase
LTEDPVRPFDGARVLLGVTGGIAAYKAIHLARLLTQRGASVEVVLSEGALEFVRPLSFEAVTGRAAHLTAFVEGDPLLHIRLARDVDAVVVAPATANFCARAAAGMADGLLTATLLATEAPVVVCPAMNDRMYAHPQTQANLRRLGEIGYAIAGRQRARSPGGRERDRVASWSRRRSSSTLAARSAERPRSAGAPCW